MSTAKKTSPAASADETLTEDVHGDLVAPDAATTDDPQEPDENAEPESEPPANSANAEARAWRKKLRAAEAERDELRGTVEALQQQNIGFMLADETTTTRRIHNPEDLFTLGGVRAGDLTDDAGAIDVAKLNAALDTLHAARPYLFDQPAPDPLAQFMRQQQSPLNHAPKSSPGTAWNKALSRNRS